MPHPTPYPRCVFCGAKANSREHAIPGWVSKRLGVKGFLVTVASSGVGTRKQPISFASHRARIFCKCCNRHFKHLEDAVIPFIVPMARGRVVSLNPDSQALLALWASKTAVALIAATTEGPTELREVVPIDHRRSIREDGRPSDETWVAYFPWRGDPLISTGRGDILDKVDPTSRVDFYGTILGFSQLAFYCVGFISGREPHNRIDGNRRPFVQFWPVQNSLVHWPPEWPPVENTRENMQAIMRFSPLRKTPLS